MPKTPAPGRRNPLYERKVKSPEGGTKLSSSAEGKKALSWLSRFRYLVVGAVLALVVTFLVRNVSISIDNDNGAGDFDPEIPPGEFLYLDNARVVAYLAQLQGGEIKSKRLTETLTESANAKVAASGSEVGASAQRERFVEREVTPTAASNYLELFDQLQDNDEDEVKLHSVDARNLKQLNELFEGEFVRITTHKLLRPGYINPFIVVKQSSTLAALFPKTDQNKRSAEALARRIGPNPRMVFALEAPLRRGEVAGRSYIRYLLPLQYQQLTDERSLLEGGGRFTIVGKVIRVFRKPNPELNGGPEYVDAATRETWKPLENAPKPLIHRASLDCTKPTLKQTRACLLDRLEKQTELWAPGAVIIPVAIHK